MHIHRVPATSLGRRGTWSRMTDYLQLLRPGRLKALRLPRFDVVVTLTTPPIIGLIGTFLRRFQGSPHIYWSMDLHPDASMALGRMSPHGPLRQHLWLAPIRSTAMPTRSSYSAPTWPTGCSEAGARREDRHDSGLEPSRRDLPLDREGEPPPQVAGAGRVKFVAMYSGNLGLAHSFDEFLEAARRLRDRADIVFLFVGDGPRQDEVRLRSEIEGLTNIRLLDPSRATGCTPRCRWPMST